MNGDTHYEILGVSADASAREIAQGYSLARQAVGADPDARERAAVEAAWATLNDKGRRVRYDLLLADTGAAAKALEEPYGVDSAGSLRARLGLASARLRSRRRGPPAAS